jgi:DNA-binding MarR family transcriptional regulator
MTDNQTINVPSIRKYFHIVPNILDDMGLDVHEHRLITHYLRRGTCTESVRTTAEHCKMSRNTVTAARNRLEEKGLITTTRTSDGITIDVTDIWETNMKKYTTVPNEGTCPKSGHGTVPNEGIKEEPFKKTLIESNKFDSICVGYLLEQIGAKRLNPAQVETIEKLEEDYGKDEVKRLIHWAANKGFSVGKTVTAIETAMRKKPTKKKQNEATTEGLGFYG